MKVVVFGGSGLIGDGVIQESLHAADVTEVVTVGRAPQSVTHPKLRQVVHSDFLDFTAISEDLAGADLCFWALGVSAVGMSPQDYERITYDYTAAAVRVLATANPAMTFVYVSGGGTDGTEQGRSRWARVKGRTENMVIAAFPGGYALRPGVVQSSHGKRSRTPMYRWASIVIAPIVPLLRRLPFAPAFMTSTEQIGQAALHLTRRGWPRHVLENRDIVAAAAAARQPRAR
ncbi:NAD-dependent epimerase/dehydratase family protein [Streptomyces diastatochromogenes]|uniref:NAD-dependent epimerase/dehydratase family protein n=1 Tax=Streptomyces diastatochromogenes TaxID=42236 RepID=UPI0036A3BA28